MDVLSEVTRSETSKKEHKLMPWQKPVASGNNLVDNNESPL